MRRLDFSIALLVCLFGSIVVAQYDDDYGSPVPPRPNIPGAFAVSGGGSTGGAFRKPVFRAQARRQQAPIQSADTIPPPRIRTNKPIGRAGRFPTQPLPSSIQPQLSPAPTPILSRPPPPPQDSIQPRPVIEEEEDLPTEEDLSPLSFATPSAFPPISNSIPIAKQPLPPSSFKPEKQFRPERPILAPSQAPEFNFPTPTRQQLRPTAPPEEPQYTRSSQFNRAQQVVRTQPPKQQFQKPPPPPLEQGHHSGQRGRKPVAQVLRRYREDNPDGSITWGFENDDGSYKEETIGVDCITRGKYGYVDPDGVRREYTYSGGIPCDKTQENQEVESEGYIDYQNNKYVLPNGDAIDLNSMVKNRARKPVQVYRN